MRSINFRIIIPIQLLILALLSAVTVYAGSHAVPINIDLSTLTSGYSTFSDGAFTFDEISVPVESWTDVLAADNIGLKKGSYTIYIDYEALADKMFVLNDGTKTNAYIKNDVGYLRCENNLEMFKFRTKADIDTFRITFRYEPYGYLKIKGISIVPNNDPLKKLILFVLLVFVVGDAYIYDRGFFRRKKAVILSLLAITLISSLPLFIPDIADGHDIVFALLRIEGDYLELKSGAFPVRMESFCLRGYGYPISIYYGDIFLYLPALLRMAGFSIVEVWKIYILLINAATAVIGYVSFKRMKNSASAALMMSLVYTCAPYRLTNLYVRAAAGEFTAMTFYPLIALAMYLIYTEEADRDKMRKNSTILALGMSAVICTHMLSTEMLIFTLVLFALILFKKTFKPAVLLTLAWAAVKTFLISAFFVIPFLDYYINVPSAISETVAGTTKELQFMGAYLSDYFTLNHFIEFEGRLPFTPGLILIAGLFVSFVLIAAGRSDKKMRYLTLLSCITLFVSSNLFPWDSFAHSTSVGRILAQIQLPTRFIGIATVFLTCLLGMELKDKALRVKGTVILYAAFAFTLISVSMFTDNYENSRPVTPYTNTSDLDTLDVGGGEYVPAGTDLYQDYTGFIRENNEGAVTSMISSGTSMIISVIDPGYDKEIILPRYSYKNYHILDMAGNEYPISNGINNLISFTLPAGYTGDLYLKYTEPWYWRLSEIISLVFLAANGMICLSHRFTKEEA